MNAAGCQGIFLSGARAYGLVAASFAGDNELERLWRQSTRKMEPQNTQNTQMDIGENII
jgi:hypothetical protein